MTTKTSRSVTIAVIAGAALALGAHLLGAAPAQAARLTATCANAAGDASLIQNVINGSKAGDEIVISGPCTLTATISLKGSRSYRGDSRATVLKQAGGVNLPALLASDSYVANTTYTGEPIVLRDLTLDGNRSANPTAGDTLVIRSWQSTVENITVQNSKGNGIRVTNTSRNGTTLSNSQVNGTIRNVFVTDSSLNGILVEDSGNQVTDWNLLDNWVAKSGQAGIRSQNSAGWVIERNHLYGNGTAGIQADRLFATSIGDNYIEDFTTAGITATLQGDAASTIHGNRVFLFAGNGTTFITVSRVNYGTGQVAVTGNTVRGNGTGTGLSFQSGGTYPLTVVSSGNSVAGVTTARTSGSGVTLTAGI